MLQVVIHEASSSHRQRPPAPAAVESADGDGALSSSSGSSSPKGSRGGGTLKTCAVCLEDYRHAPWIDHTNKCEVPPSKTLDLHPLSGGLHALARNTSLYLFYPRCTISSTAGIWVAHGTNVVRGLWSEMQESLLPLVQDAVSSRWISVNMTSRCKPDCRLAPRASAS